MASHERKSKPRSIWTGSVSFGLVNVPVRLYPAVREHTLHFRYVHAKDNSPIGYQKVCKAEEKPVSDDEVVKAFEFEKGEYVFMTDEDFEGAQAVQTKTIEVTDFVPVEEIDPIYFAKTYYAGPADGAERVYALLVKAIEESGLVAVGKFVLRERQHVGALRVRDGVIALEQLHFADEIVDTRDIRPKTRPAGKEELALARRLIEANTTEWKPSRYKDTYRADLRAAIEAKRKSKKTHRAAEVETDEARPPDLLEALQASLERSKATGSRRRSRSSGTGASRRARGGQRARR
jgi:DNA end-binding protein Ku